MKSPVWIDRRALLLLHSETLSEHGGFPGFRDEALFEAALARPRHLHNYEPHADLARLATAYAFGIVRNHPFNDGNKRTGFLAAGLFLMLNGRELKVDQAEAVTMIERLAAGKLGLPELETWIHAHMIRPRTR
ncbi:MAG: type II toxin-antitoxin system death-on-curing family toxin [Terriglobales bacterium]|jgi:death-on-curing protein